MSRDMAVWKNKKTGKYVRGYWTYNWSSDRFHLSIIDNCGLRNHDFVTCCDHPEWGNFILIRDDQERAEILASISTAPTNTERCGGDISMRSHRKEWPDKEAE
jgi:hypothetical protein